MLEIPERQLALGGWTASQRPSRASLLEELRRVPGGADPGLLECVAKGAAFHHAGLLSLALQQGRFVATVGLGGSTPCLSAAAQTANPNRVSAHRSPPLPRPKMQA